MRFLSSNPPDVRIGGGSWSPISQQQKLGFCFFETTYHKDDLTCKMDMQGPHETMRRHLFEIIPDSEHLYQYYIYYIYIIYRTLVRFSKRIWGVPDDESKPSWIFWGIPEDDSKPCRLNCSEPELKQHGSLSTPILNWYNVCCICISIFLHLFFIN